MCAYKPSYSYPFPVYQPAMRVISAITNALQVTVTTTIDHQYQPGIIVRIDIPTGLGMQQLNQQIGAITSVPTTTTFTMAIDTTKYDVFTPPTMFPPPYQDAMSVPVGEINSTIDYAVVNALPYKA